MTCKLCNKVKKLIKAHIIPEFLYRDIDLYIPDKKGQGRIHGFTNTNGNLKFIKKGLPTGIYDTTILCKECDSLIIKEYDDYGKKIFTDLLNRETLQNAIEQKLQFLEFGLDDYFLFKTFIASIFWRASISNRPEFTIVKLNETEKIIKEIIKTRNPSLIDMFEIVIFFLNIGLSNQILMNPIEVNKLNSHFFSFIAGGFLINLFPDKSKVLNAWSGFVIKNKNSFQMPIIQDVETSKYIINSFIDSEILK
jgi:hypothetical protein